MNNEYLENIATLNSFLDLEENWDGEGAHTFNNQLITQLSQLLKTLKIQPDIFPLQNGAIVFEYGNVKEKYLEIVFYPTNHIDIYQKDITGKSIKKLHEPYTQDKIHEVINNYIN